MATQPSDISGMTRRALLQRAVLALPAAVFVTISWPVPAVLAEEDDDGGGDDGGSDDGGSDDGGDDHDDDSDSDDENDDSGPGSSGSSRDSGDSSGDDGRDDDRSERGTLDQSDALRAVRDGRAMPFKAALKRVENRYGGSVIDVTLQSSGRRLEYRFKLRTDRGTVRTIRMDAKTGRFLGLAALFR